MSIERKSDLSIKDEGMMINIEGKINDRNKRGSLTAKLSEAYKPMSWVVLCV